MTPVEKESWSVKASLVGLDLSEYIRRCVERRAIAPVPPEVNRLTAVELGRIGVNLNQQVRAMNTAVASGQYISNIDEALATVNEVTLAVQKLQLELIGEQA
jgi:hypothetical protein